MPPDNKAYNKLQKALEKDEFVRLSKGVSFSISGVVQYGIPTGLPLLDLHLERNGYPAGRIIELFGYEMTGKTTLALHTVAQVQASGGQALWIDTEKSFDPDRAAQLGVDTDELWIADADTIEAVFRTLEAFFDQMAETNFTGPMIAVVDSVGGVGNEWELKKNFEADLRVGLDAKIIKAGVKRLTHKISKSHGSVIFVNHAYESMNAFGSAKSSGGRGIKYMATIRVEIANLGNITKGKGVDTLREGQKSRINIRKARGSPLKHPIFDTQLLATGFDQVGDLLIAMENVGMIQQNKDDTFSLGETTFDEDQWPAILEQLGGFARVYPKFLDYAVKTKHIRKWGEMDTEEETQDGVC